MKSCKLDDQTSKWFWCINWCKKKGISPWCNLNWKTAEEAYQKHLNEL